MHDSVCHITRCTPTRKCPSCQINAKAVGSVHSLFYLLEFIFPFYCFSVFLFPFLPYLLFVPLLSVFSDFSLFFLFSLSLSLPCLKQRKEREREEKEEREVREDRDKRNKNKISKNRTLKKRRNIRMSDKIKKIKQNVLLHTTWRPNTY